MTTAYLTNNNAYTAIYVPATGVLYTLGGQEADPALDQFFGECGNFEDWSSPERVEDCATEEEITDMVGEILAVRDDEQPAADIREPDHVRERWGFFGLPMDECPVKA